MPSIGPKLKRRLFFISVFGLTGPDEYVILKVTQESTVYDVIAQVSSWTLSVDVERLLMRKLT